jgi:hypothetical protein
LDQECQGDEEPGNDKSELNCRISWEISQFCDSELPGVDRLPSVVTLTGTTTQVQADSCEDFVQKIWGTKNLLNWLVKALQGHYECKSICKCVSYVPSNSYKPVDSTRKRGSQ